MEKSPESLERKLDNPDWKQWLPLCGPFIAVKDAFQGKPYIMDPSPRHKIRFYYSVIHHGIFSAYSGYHGMINLIEQYLQ